jgi:hypothetical protein
LALPAALKKLAVLYRLDLNERILAGALIGCEMQKLLAGELLAHQQFTLHAQTNQVEA